MMLKWHSCGDDMSAEYRFSEPVHSVTVIGRISRPAGTGRRNVHWHYAATVGGCHLLALLALFPWFFSWTGVILMMVGIFLFGSVGINLCYHRLLSHRSFQCPIWLEHSFAVFGVCCLEDSPARWVAVHRLHHHRADHQPDPHSPLVGLFWGYMGWLFIENIELSRVSLYDRYARDIIRDPFYATIERNSALIILLSWLAFFTGGFLVEMVLGGAILSAVQFGLSVWVWGVMVRTIAVWHITWTGNSFPHVYGYRNYETNDNSRNNFIVGIITNGEGWHNNHHADPNSASNSHRWWEFDLTYLFLRLLAALGLARNIITPRGSVAPDS
jgi:fatty-acid desaturase